MTTLETLAERITVNDGRHRRTNRRLRVIAVFLLLAFMFLAYRSEVSDRRIQANTARIAAAQATSCEQGAEYIAKHNRLQDTLAAIDRRDVTRDPQQRDARIAARERARIIPIPTCP